MPYSHVLGVHFERLKYHQTDDYVALKGKYAAMLEIEAVVPDIKHFKGAKGAQPCSWITATTVHQ